MSLKNLIWNVCQTKQFTHNKGKNSKLLSAQSNGKIRALNLLMNHSGEDAHETQYLWIDETHKLDLDFQVHAL